MTLLAVLYLKKKVKFHISQRVITAKQKELMQEALCKKCVRSIHPIKRNWICFEIVTGNITTKIMSNNSVSVRQIDAKNYV